MCKGKEQSGRYFAGVNDGLAHPFWEGSWPRVAPSLLSNMSVMVYDCTTKAFHNRMTTLSIRKELYFRLELPKT
jgi:hypothetical protein